MKHKWAKEIIAWANGAEIEMRCQEPSIKKKIWSRWEAFDNEWTEEDWWEFRIKPNDKPQPKEPQYLYAYETQFNAVQLSLKDNLESYKYIGKIKLEQYDV